MAKIISNRYIITLSKLVKESYSDIQVPMIDDNVIETLQSAVEELINDETVIVEIDSE